MVNSVLGRDEDVPIKTIGSDQVKLIVPLVALDVGFIFLSFPHMSNGMLILVVMQDYYAN